MLHSSHRALRLCALQGLAARLGQSAAACRWHTLSNSIKDAESQLNGYSVSDKEVCCHVIAYLILYSAGRHVFTQYTAGWSSIDSCLPGDVQAKMTELQELKSQLEEALEQLGEVQASFDEVKEAILIVAFCWIS
jgi:hypothetical protein